MPSIESNGRHLYYTDTGGTGPAVILGHGYFLDGSMFAAQQAALSPPYRVITWDARGHGGTPDDGVPFTYWDAAKDVIGLMDALRIDTAAVGGVSQGGFIALRLALLAPERVSSLLLFDTEAEANDAETRAGYRGLFAALAEHGPIDDLAVGLAGQLIGDHPVAAEWIAKWQAADQLPLNAAADTLIDRDDISGRLDEIRCPVLLVRGSQDKSLPQERMELLADRLPGATDLKIVDGAAHSPPLTHPEQVNRLLTDFLGAHLPA